MAEMNYDFRRRMLEVHRPNRRNYSLAKASDEIEIDDSWSVYIENDADRVIYEAAKDLCEYFFVSMGISLRLVRGESVSPAIVFGVDTSLADNTYLFRAENDCLTLCGADSRMSAQAGYYAEDLMNLAEAPFIKKQSIIRRHMYSPRMIHSGFGLDSFPDEHIRAIAHSGINALLIFVKDINITPHGYQDFNDLIYRASKYGVDVYAYSYMLSRIHPEDEGAEEFYENLYGKLFRECPGFKGIVFVGESCEFPSHDPHTTGILRRDNLDENGQPIIRDRVSPGWWPCFDYPVWLNMIKRIIRSKKPDADIVFWTYNWGYVEEKYRLELLRNIPTDVSLLVTFEMFEDVVREGIVNRTVDYTLFFEGPGKYFVSEARLAAERGIRLYAMTNTGGLTWDVGTIPYEPAPYQWMRRYSEMKKAHDAWGLCGTMDSHHYGFYPSFISELAKNSFSESLPDPNNPDMFIPAKTDDEMLFLLAARDFGKKYADSVLSAYADFSDGIRNLISTNEDQYGPFRIGPSYPLLLFADDDAQFPTVPWAHFGGNEICDPVYKYDLSTPDKLDKINYEIRCHTKTAELYNRGIELLDTVIADMDKSNSEKLEEAKRLVNMCRFIRNAARTTVNVKEFKKLKEALRDECDSKRICDLKNSLREIALKELDNTRDTLPLVDYDSRLGYEPSMEYMCDRLHLEWKIQMTEKMIKTELEN